MNNVVLDASAILALIFDEPGADRVAACLPDALVSTVNIAEVATRLLAQKVPTDTAATIIETLQFSLRPFDYTQALATAQLRSVTRCAGLSLGDRACLALGRTHQAEVITADRVWQNVATAADVSVTVIR